MTAVVISPASSAATATASTRPSQNSHILSAINRPKVMSVQGFKQRAESLLTTFLSRRIYTHPAKQQLQAVTETSAQTFSLRMSTTQEVSKLMSEYSRDARSMLLDGRALDFDLPLHLLDEMNKTMAATSQSVGARLVPQLKKVATVANKQLSDSAAAKATPVKERLQQARDILNEIHRVHLELKRLMAEFGSFFQPLCTIPAGFFAVPSINISESFLRHIATTWRDVANAIMECIFSTVNVERTAFHQQDAGENPEAVQLRKAISDAITLWCRIQDKGNELLVSKFIPQYLDVTQKALERVGARMTVKELLDITIIRIANEQDRFKQLFSGRDTTPVRRVVQLGLVKSQVQRISTDAEIGLDAALRFSPNPQLFPKLVMMLDFDEACIKAICEAITRNVSASLAFMISSMSAEAAKDATTTISTIAEVYEAYRRVISACNTNEQAKLRFYVSLRAGINAGLSHAGMETTLAHHFHRLLKDTGNLPGTDLHFRASDVRAAVSSFAPLLKDVSLFARVYQHRLGTRLMSRKSPNIKLERFAVDELAASLGISYTHPMKSMINHFNKKHTRNSNNNKFVNTVGGGHVACSRYAWPAFSMVSSSTVTLHPTIEQIVQADVAEFKDSQKSSSSSSATTAASSNRPTRGNNNNSLNQQEPITATSHPLLTNVELRTGKNAGIFGNAVQCSILLYISESDKQTQGLRANEIAETMKMTEREALWMLGTLTKSQTIVQDTATGKFKMVALEPEKRIVLSSVWGISSKASRSGLTRSSSSASKKKSSSAAASSTATSSSSSSSYTKRSIDQMSDDSFSDEEDRCVIQ